MKKILTFAISALIAFNIFAQAPTMEKGNKAYEAKEYHAAIEAYEELIEQGYANDILYYNLGNAYYRSGDMAHARLYYEKAHKLNPKDRDIRENMELAESKTTDKIDAIPQIAVVRTYNKMVEAISLNGWRAITLILLALALSAIVIFFLGRDLMTRKVSFVSTWVLLFLCLIGFSSSMVLSHRMNSMDEAIVTSPSVSIKGSPDSNSVEKFILHAGTKVAIKDELNGWLMISIADGSKGWLNETDIERI